MSRLVTPRLFEPGTAGWTEKDLRDPDVQWHWSQGRYEWADGVLTKMAPQGFQGILPLDRLRRILEHHLDAIGDGGEFYTEVDVLLRPGRVARPDMIFLTAEQHRAQQQIEAQRLLADEEYRPVYVPPMLVVESVSPNHEAHDRLTKRQWYAQAKIALYWLLTAHERSLVCLNLAGGDYVEEASGKDAQPVRTGAPGGIEIPLADLWRKV